MINKVACIVLGFTQALVWASGAQLAGTATWEAAAQAGDVNAMLRLGWHYQQQRLDPGRALVWYARAAEAGSVEAQYHLAQSYLNGALGNVDAAQSEYWYGRVREQGLCPSVIRPVSDSVE